MLNLSENLADRTITPECCHALATAELRRAPQDLQCCMCSPCRCADRVAPGPRPASLRYARHARGRQPRAPRSGGGGLRHAADDVCLLFFCDVYQLSLDPVSYSKVHAKSRTCLYRFFAGGRRHVTLLCHVTRKLYRTTPGRFFGRQVVFNRLNILTTLDLLRYPSLQPCPRPRARDPLPRRPRLLRSPSQWRPALPRSRCDDCSRAPAVSCDTLDDLVASLLEK